MHQTRLNGIINEIFQNDSEIPLKSALWTSCKSKNKGLVLKSSLFLEARRGAGGIVTVDSLDEAASQTYKIGWRRCRPS